MMGQRMNSRRAGFGGLVAAALAVTLSGCADPGAARGADAEQAAPTPVGVGVNKDAAGVNDGDKEQAAGVPMRVVAPPDPDLVAGDLAASGGCVPGYGGDDRSCLPGVPPRLASTYNAGMSGLELAVQWTCADVRALLPKGIKVDKVAPVADFPGARDGKDPLRLDTNGDGTACGAGD